MCINWISVWRAFSCYVSRPSLETTHGTFISLQLKELNEELSKTQDKVAYLERKLDEQLHEVTTLNESRQGEMEGLESRVKHEVEEKTALLEQTIQQQYQVYALFGNIY